MRKTLIQSLVRIDGVTHVRKNGVSVRTAFPFWWMTKEWTQSVSADDFSILVDDKRMELADCLSLLVSVRTTFLISWMTKEWGLRTTFPFRWMTKEWDLRTVFPF